MSDDAGMLTELMAVRGVEAAALVGVDGDFLGGESSDEGLLERMLSTLTSALAAGEALADLFDGPVATHAGPASADGSVESVDAVTGAGEATDSAPDHDAGQRQLMVMYQDGGPILFTPLPDGRRVAVVALSSSHDIGRARFQLRGLTSRG